jgi:hypothetical protein
MAASARPDQDGCPLGAAGLPFGAPPAARRRDGRHAVGTLRPFDPSYEIREVWQMSEPQAGQTPPTADPEPPVAGPGPRLAGPEAAGTARVRAKDHSPWNWLLFVPIVVPLITPLFNMDSPRLLGFPTFYWLQFAFIVLGVTTTTVVYQMTKKRG